MTDEEIATQIVDAALAIHRDLGPGLFESVYEAALADELEFRGLRVARQVPLEARRRGRVLGVAFRADLLVEERVVVEIKAVTRLNPVHFRQVRVYLKLSDTRLAFLLNFDVAYMRDGIRRLERHDANAA